LLLDLRSSIIEFLLKKFVYFCSKNFIKNMYTILFKKKLTSDTFLLEVNAPRIAKVAKPGQFVIVISDEKGERIPLTICDYNANKGTITLIIKAIGYSTKKMVQFSEGDAFKDIAGPLGRPSEWFQYSLEELKKMKMLFIGGGVGIAPVYPQVKWLHEHGISVDVIIGARTRNMLILEKELSEISNLHVTTDEEGGLVTDIFKDLVVNKNRHYDEVIAIGPMVMMKYAVATAKSLGIRSVVSLNSLMLDGTGMCGACRITVAGKTRFTCVDGPEFAGEAVDFDEALRRQALGNYKEGRRMLEKEEKTENHVCHIGGVTDEKIDRKNRISVRNQKATERVHNFNEVCYGYNTEEAVNEAKRCLKCKKPLCVDGCPVRIDIPEFIGEIAAANFEAAAKTIDRDSALPAVCGRVCPQETQCEIKCVLGKKGDPIAIGKLERFAGDWARENGISFAKPVQSNGHKVAIVGSGPAGITCAKELLVKGYEVTIFEALHEYGGVLVYGIPSFRLPKETVVKHEIENVRKLGAKFENNVIIGRTVTIDDLFDKEGFDAVFIGSGAGLPSFMNIPGENLNGVVSANEFLTRNNLLFAYKEGFDTPNYVGKKTCVVGGGNVAMDAARTAVRLGAEVSIVYRRSEAELPARLEEVEHAKEEGIHFYMLTNPVEILGDEKGFVNGMKCIKMELGEPDSSGRRRPVPVEGSEFVLETDFVIMSIGTSPNPLIANTTPGLEINKWGCIVADEITGETSRKGIFAGGDAVSGAATVILAMGAGKTTAEAIDRYIHELNK
jgi:glutamate synthase (NADPH/NADH) small chain